MELRRKRILIIVGLVSVCALGIWLVCSSSLSDSIQNPVTTGAGDEHGANSAASRNPGALFQGTAGKQDPNFPVNAAKELPFLGKVQCHMRQEAVKFTVRGKQMELPFKLYYLPSGMLVRAEYAKPGAKNYENDPKFLTELYKSSGESWVGFPEKPAPADLVKVLQSLYDNEPFERSTRLNITWVLWQNPDEQILPRYIVDVFGVSPGLMRVPENPNEAFLKYRVFLSPEGEALMTDNAL